MMQSRDTSDVVGNACHRAWSLRQFCRQQPKEYQQSLEHLVKGTRVATHRHNPWQYQNWALSQPAPVTMAEAKVHRAIPLTLS